MAAKQKNISDFVEKLTNELFDLLQVKADIKVSEAKAHDEGVIVNVEIDSEEAGLLIGSHGATLSAIQSFIGMAVKQHTGEWVRVSVDVSGWKGKHEDYLVSLANQAAERARSTQEEQYLYNLNPSQRRVIHSALSEMPDIQTESQGEGDDRYLVVSLK